MTHNVGDKDRMYRAIAGVIVLLWGVANANPVGLIGFVILATAYFRWCPVYIPMGIDSTKK
ncbi:hypothetical protein CKO27_10935 [Thiocystis violacea]|nr:hypothetical protein [Thiocystis violacea]